MEKRMLDMERQFAAFRQIRILDDLDDTEVLYQAPPSAAGPGGGGPPSDGDVLTFDTARTSEFGGIWVPKPGASLGPYVEGRTTFTLSVIVDNTELLDDATDGLWLVTIFMESEAGIGNQGGLEVWDDGDDLLAGNRYEVNTYTGNASASVAFLWWPSCGTNLHAEAFSRDSGGTGLAGYMRWRSIRLTPTPEGLTPYCGGA
jgi:hypothetical protein